MGPILVMFTALMVVGTLPHWIPACVVDGLGTAIVVVLLALCVKLVLDLMSQ